MKKITLLFTPLLLIVGLDAKQIEAKGTTLGHYSKPGAPINMSYKSTKVDVKKTADINITLTTTVTHGTMEVMLNFDENLIQMDETPENLSFELTPEERSFTIKVKVQSQKEGLYYIRLLTRINKGQGQKLRSFAVPVYIGDNPKPKTRGAVIMKALSGENISVSKAVETIRTLD